MIKHTFNLNTFNDNLNNINPDKELTDIKVNVHKLISTISDYIDCEAQLINNLTEETVEHAMAIVFEEGHAELHSMLAASRMRSLTKNTRSNRKISQADLF